MAQADPTQVGIPSWSGAQSNQWLAWPSVLQQSAIHHPSGLPQFIGPDPDDISVEFSPQATTRLERDDNETSGSTVPISTSVIYSPIVSLDTLPPHGPVAVQAEELKSLETHFPSGGKQFSVHSPHTALSWLEAHYEDALLDAIRARGLGGPIAAMLTPDAPALVIFGSILDNCALEAARLLADLSRLTVIIRPFADSPYLKWNSRNADQQADELRHVEPVDQRPDGSISDGEESENDGSTASEDDMDIEDLRDMNGILRLRGGAGNSERYIPQKGPVHNVDIHLEFCQKGELHTKSRDDHPLHKISILCKMQFTVQSKYTDHYFNGYRPQAISWTKFIVVPRDRDLQVLCDRSYGSIGFLVHERKLDCEGFTRPKHTAKSVETKTRETKGSLTAGFNPTAGATFALSRTKGEALERHNDRVTPMWSVDYEPGDQWSTEEQSYSEQNVSFNPSEIKTYNERGMDVEYSMGINVGDLENPENTELPKISFIARNQTILWVPDKSLKAKGYGIIVFTSKVDLVGNSVCKTVANADNGATQSPALVSLSIGVPPSKEKPNIFQKLASKWTVLPQQKADDVPDPRISTLPLYELNACGWDATTERWRMPIYPRLDRMLRRAEKQETNLYALQRVAENRSLSKSQGKQRDPGHCVPKPTEEQVHAKVPTALV
ncbi:hypothetical protein B0H14DRAFT_2622183 [Mycena olivaceomarginata]|nr:hypothetical protein B0H14DRAFT_2622183 [Mycena olivaceomarginata]